MARDTIRKRVAEIVSRTDLYTDDRELAEMLKPVPGEEWLDLLDGLPEERVSRVVKLALALRLGPRSHV